MNTLDNLVSQDIPADTDMLLIAAPTGDFSADELSKIDTFLENGGKRGKALLFFAAASSPDLPNLYDFLAEWGIKISDGTLYETNESNYVGDPTTIGLSNQKSDYTKSVNEATNVLYVAGNCLPMETAFSTQGNRTTTSLLSSSETVVVRPTGVGDEWKPSGKGGKAYAAGILSKDTIYAENMAELNSYVLAFSSTDLISSAWSQYSFVNNNEFVLSAINSADGRDDSAITITNKTISTSTFSTPPTALTIKIVGIVFMGVIPVALIIIGIIVWVRRKNR